MKDADLDGIAGGIAGGVKGGGKDGRTADKAREGDSTAGTNNIFHE
jgi:hypothetical protein